jgi:hypothetical protein
MSSLDPRRQDVAADVEEALVAIALETRMSARGIDPIDLSPLGEVRTCTLPERAE